MSNLFFSHNVLAILHMREMSHVELSLKIRTFNHKWGRRNLSRRLTGDTKVSLDEVRDVATALEVDPGDLAFMETAQFINKYRRKNDK